MALTTTQVNSAFLASLGRPAEGQAVAWGAGSLNLDTLLNNIFIAENTEDFVESLYTGLLSRSSDAEGKAFWNALLATTPKEVVMAQFIAAVLQAGALDPSNADYQGYIAAGKAFIETLYTNLLGRSADAEGLEFWSQALANGLSRGDLLAQFTAAVLAGGADSDDYQALTAKLAVADTFSAKFFAFNADVTADEKKAALADLVTTMEGVTAGTTVEDVQEDIDLFAGNYQNRTSQVFTKADDDDLDSSEATAATSFRGTLNLIDAEKGTIQTTDRVTGNTDFEDTLVVNVTSDSTHKLLDLDGDLPIITDVEKLIINNGSANIEGTLNASFTSSAKITGTGDVNLKVNHDLKDLSVSSGTKADVAVEVNGALDNYTGGNAGEEVTINKSIKKASLGAGDDNLIINGDVVSDGAIDLGAGNDELVINSDIILNGKDDKKVTLDGGAGREDKLTLNNQVDITGVKSIKGFEIIDAKADATGNAPAISAEAANGLKAKFVNGSNLEVSGDAKATTSINLSGLGVENKEDTASVTLRDLTKETITLSKDKGITERIEISNPDAEGKEQVSVTIKNFAKGDTADKLVVADNSNVVAPLDLEKTDKIDPSKATQALKYIQENATGLSTGTNYVAINTANGKASYVWKVDVKAGAELTRDDIKLVATVDKALSATDFENGGYTPVPSERIDTKDYPVTGGELDLSTVEMSDPNKQYVVELSTNPDVASITSVKLPAGINTAAVTIVDSSATTKPAGAVQIDVPADAVIKVLSAGVGSREGQLTSDSTVYNVTVAPGAKVESIITNDSNNNVKVAEGTTSVATAGGDDVIDITGTTTVGTVLGGDGVDTLVIAENAADNLIMSSIEKLQYTGTSISSDSILLNAQGFIGDPVAELEVINASGTAGKELEVKAGNKGVDLSTLVNSTAAGALAAAIKVTGVKANSTVTLSKGADAKALVETVVLGAATGVTVNNVQAGDLVTSDNFTLNGSFAELKGTIETGKLYFTTVTAGQTAQQAVDAAIAAASFKGDAIIAVNSGSTATGNADIFVVKAGVATPVVKVDNIINAQDEIKDGALAFDGGSPEPTPGNIVYDAAEDRFTATVSGDEILNLSADVLKGHETVSKLVITANNGSITNFDTSLSKAASLTNLEVRGNGNITLNDANLNRSNITSLKETAGNATFNLATANSKVTGVDLGAGDDTLNLSAKYSALATINLGEGNDTLDITADQAALATINAGDGNDKISLNAAFTGVDSTVNLGDGTNSLTLVDKFNATGKIVVFNGGSGDDTFDISAVTAVAKLGTLTIDGKNGNNDTVKLAAIDYTSASLTLTDIEVLEGSTSGASTTKIKLESIADKSGSTKYTAKATEIKGDMTLTASSDATMVDTSALTGTGNITIDLSGTTASNVTEVTGSADAYEIISLGNGAFTNSSLTALTDIDAIVGGGSTAEVKAAVFGEGSTITGLGGQLKVAFANNLDLSNVTEKVGTSATLNITDVTGAVTLTDKNAGIIDTVTLASTFGSTGAEANTIAGAGSKDKIDFSTLASAGFTTYADKDNTSVTANTAYYVETAFADKTIEQVVAQPLAFADVFKLKAAAKGYAAVQLSDGIAIYEATDATTSGTLKLLGVVNDITSAIDGGTVLTLI